MKSRFTLYLFFSLFVLAKVQAQCPTENLTISSQTELDSFKIKYPLCTDLEVKLWLSSNSIIDLSPLDQLQSINWISIYGCNSLFIADINENLQISELFISNCTILESARIINNVIPNGDLFLSALPKLSVNETYELETLNDLTINNLKIESLSKFKDLTAINGKLTVNNNTSLTDISLLDEIELNSIDIHNNPLLESCSIDAICELLKDDLESISIHNNGDECSYLHQIIKTCNPDTIICYTNELLLEKQRDLDYLSNFSDQCIDSINNVFITSNFTNDIVDLSNLIRFEKLNGLIVSSTDQLISLKGLDSLHSLGYLAIYENESLASFEGLGNLKNMLGIEIAQNPSLTALSSNELVLDELGYLIIDDTPINDLSAISNIDSLEGLRLTNTELKNFDWGENILFSGNVKIFSNENLENITLNNMDHAIGDFEIERNNKLTRIEGITFKDTVQNISIENNAFLTSIESIKGPKVCRQRFSIYGTNVINLQPWQGFEYASYISVGDNGLLESFELISTFKDIKELSVFYNSKLPSLGSLPNNIQEIGKLTLVGNDLLHDISILDNDAKIDDILIKDNPLLESCDILPICKEYKSVYPNILLEGNGENCNLVELNFDCEWGQNAYGDVIVKSQNDIDSIMAIFPSMDSVHGDLVLDFSANSEIADFSFFDNIAYVRDELEIRHLKQNNVFEMFEGVSVSGLILIDLETPTLEILDFTDTLSQLRLWYVNGISDFSGMENVTKIDGKVDIVGASITSTDGLDNLDFMSDMQMVDCPLLTNINSFSDVNWIRDLRLSNLPQFVDFELFNEMDLPRHLQFDDLPNLSVFPSFIETQNPEVVSIAKCNSLIDLRLNTIDKITTRFSLFENEKLQSISLDNLNQAGIVSISNNDLITDIKMPVLHTINAKLDLSRNEILQNINGINPAALAQTIIIEDNPKLEDCHMELICNNYNAGTDITISNNLGCQTLEDITDNCSVSTIETESNFVINAFPNPVLDVLSLEGNYDSKTLKMYNSIGQQINFELFSNQIDMRHFASGIYYLKVENNTTYRIISVFKK